jgi:hypothetical protein
MARHHGEIQAKAKDAMKRLTSGFWDAEYKVREERLSIIKNSGKSTDDARRFFAEQTKVQITSAGNEDEKLYIRARKIFLAAGTETALSALIDRKKLDTLNDAGRQRYIFDLSAKLQEFKDRYIKEQEYNLPDTAATM